MSLNVRDSINKIVGYDFAANNQDFLNPVTKQKKNPFVHALHGQKLVSDVNIEDPKKLIVEFYNHWMGCPLDDQFDWDTMYGSVRYYFLSKRFKQGMSPNKWADSMGLPHFHQSILDKIKEVTSPIEYEIISRPTSLLKISKSPHFGSCLWESYPHRLIEFAFFPTSFVVCRRDRAGNIQQRRAFMILSNLSNSMLVNSRIYGTGNSQQIYDLLIQKIGVPKTESSFDISSSPYFQRVIYSTSNEKFRTLNLATKEGKLVLEK